MLHTLNYWMTSSSRLRLPVVRGWGATYVPYIYIYTGGLRSMVLLVWGSLRLAPNTCTVHIHVHVHVAQLSCLSGSVGGVSILLLLYLFNCLGREASLCSLVLHFAAGCSSCNKVCIKDQFCKYKCMYMLPSWAASVAQLVECLSSTQNVAGSSPAWGNSSFSLEKKRVSSGVVALLCLLSVTGGSCTVLSYSLNTCTCVECRPSTCCSVLHHRILCG